MLNWLIVDDKLIWHSARLGTNPPICASSAESKARKALSAIRYAQCAVRKYLKFDIRIGLDLPKFDY